MSKKFIPNGDEDFVMMAEAFARTVGKEPARFEVSDVDAAALTATVARFRAAFQAARHGARSALATAAKEEARGAAEKLIRRIANTVRASDSIDALSKMALGLRERTKKPKVLTVPNEAPRLTFVRAIHEGGCESEHELKFSSQDYKSKPEGATRLELFVDLISPEAAVPEHPGVGGTRPFYLRSYARSPIRLFPPIANVPMRVVYWARWADTAGNVGPFSKTAAGWVEGGSHFNQRMRMPNAANKPKVLHVNVEQLASQQGEESMFVALLAAGRFTTAATQPALADETTSDRRQLEGPVEEAA